MSHYRSRKKPTFRDKFYTNIAPIVTGLGASVVIIGALFKIQHWQGASEMLIIGLGTEAVLFALFAFAPQSHDPDWALVYKELDPEYGDEGEDEKAGDGKNSVVKRLEDMLEKAKIDQALVEKLGRGMNNLSESVGKISEVGNATVATTEYAKNVKQAAAGMAEMNKSFGEAVNAVSSVGQSTGAVAKAFGKAAADATNMTSQVEAMTKNLASLNAVYELEIKDANNHVKAMNKFFGGMATAMDAMATAAQDTQSFKNELGKLNKNLTALNTVYGNMLAAMKG